MGIVENLSTLLLTGNAAWLWAIVPLAIMAYLAPLLIAFERHHRYAWTIGAINLATGWTLVGWLAALIWAVNKDVRDTAAAVPASSADAMLEPRWNDIAISDNTTTGGETKKCPYCAEHIKAEAIVCRFCSRDLALSHTKAPAARPVTDLDADEKRRLESLLEEAGEQTKDPRLLDVFEYMRLLEETDTPAAANVIPMASPETASEPHAQVASDDEAPAYDEAWAYPEPATGSRR